MLVSACFGLEIQENHERLLTPAQHIAVIPALRTVPCTVGVSIYRTIPTTVSSTKPGLDHTYSIRAPAYELIQVGSVATRSVQMAGHAPVGNVACLRVLLVLSSAVTPNVVKAGLPLQLVLELLRPSVMLRARRSNIAT